MAFHTETQFQGVSSDIIEQIKTLIKTSPRVLDNHAIATRLGLSPDAVEKICMDIYDALIIKERLAEGKYITLEDFDEWLKENDLV